jgi:hypothetical protein
VEPCTSLADVSLAAYFDNIYCSPHQVLGLSPEPLQDRGLICARFLALFESKRHLPHAHIELQHLTTAYLIMMQRARAQQTQVIHNSTVVHSAHVNMNVQHNTTVQYTMALKLRVEEKEVLCASQQQALQAADARCND